MENVSTISEKPFWEHKNYSYADEWFLVGSNSQFFLILSAYLVFVLKVGPSLMKDRAPFKLTNILLAYNIVQVAVSAYIFKLAFGIIYNTITEEKCIYESDKLQYKYFYALHVYTLAKLSELLDTIFFVLRKKDRQVSFLHVYHHSAVFFYSWALMSYNRQAFLSVTVVGFLNSFVHLVMYSYYALSVFPSLEKFLWWKKYITKMQMIQFAMIIVYVIYENTMTPCKLPSTLFIHMLANVSLVFILFADFYRKTYKTSPNAKKK
ncbi:elongation of very long chain fatty acids protein 2-like [Aricia agestis]|uniref:elongation of very long chain fatty acids protein 2-like n=1 Tax=Aricia agestis TaxID=91739 RepID=UPI001C20AAC1|nr:elongation of very long chain fatty acids protein 2-like [Aricia agestis]